LPAYSDALQGYVRYFFLRDFRAILRFPCAAFFLFATGFSLRFTLALGWGSFTGGGGANCTGGS
jgi:hypothetical protein